MNKEKAKKFIEENKFEIVVGVASFAVPFAFQLGVARAKARYYTDNEVVRWAGWTNDDDFGIILAKKNGSADAYQVNKNQK